MRKTTFGGRLIAAIEKQPKLGKLARKQKELEEREKRVKRHYTPRVIKPEPPPPKIELAVETTTTVTAEEVVQPIVTEFPKDFAQPVIDWLAEETPFKENLRVITGHLKDSKAQLSFALEQAISREKKKSETFKSAEAELLVEQLNIETLKKNLQKIDETISSCALVAEQSVGIISLLTNGHKKLPAPAYHKPSPDDPTICRRKDVLEFFQSNPGVNWTAAEIRGKLPQVKQNHAKKALPPLLGTLCSDGKINRVSEGVYRL